MKRCLPRRRKPIRRPRRARRRIRILAPEIVVVRRRQRRMRIRAADQPERVGIDPELGAEHQPTLQRGAGVFTFFLLPECLAREARFLPRRTARMPRTVHAVACPTVPGLEVRKFVRRRQHGVGLAVAFELRHFEQGLEPATLFRPCRGRCTPVESVVGEHLAVAQVGIVRDREHAPPGFGLKTGQVGPKVLRVATIGGRKRHEVAGRLRPVAEDHHSVQVAKNAVDRAAGTPLVSREGGEPTRFVVRLGAVDDVAPDGPPLLRLRVEVAIGLAEAVAEVGIVALGTGRCQAGRDTHPLRVVGDDQEVQGTANSRRHAVAGRHGLAARKAVGGFRRYRVVAEREGVTGREAGVDVRITPEHIDRMVVPGIRRVGLRRVAERGAEGDE